MVSKTRGHGEGGIRQRKDGTWEATISNGYRLVPDKATGELKPKRDRKFLYGKTRKEVQDKLDAAKRDQQRGVQLPAARLTVAHYLTDWLDRNKPPTLKPSTYRSYEQTVRLYLIPGLGHLKLAKLDPQQVQAFLDAKRTETTRTGKPYSARSIAVMRDVLRKALTDAAAWDMVSRNVALLVRPPKGKARPAVSLTSEQAKTLLDATKGDRLEVLYRLCLALGLRQGEALALTWDAIDFTADTLTISEGMQRVYGETTGTRKSTLQRIGTKSETSKRTINLPPFLATLLRTQQITQTDARLAAGPKWQDHGLVFSTRYGKPLDGPNVTRYFQRLLERAGLPHMRYHDLRHSALSFMAAQGVPVDVARDIIGHSDARLTMNVYRQVLPEEHDRAAELLEGFFGGK